MTKKTAAFAAAKLVWLTMPLAIVHTQANAGDQPHAGIVSTGDLSAARKKKKQIVVRPAGPRPQLWGWRPADPSFDQTGRPYQPPPGLSCPVDLGYGRWASCNDDF